jgi:hypothetical protein
MELGTKRNEVQLSFVPWLLSFLVLLPMPSGATRRPRGSEPYYRCPISELFHGCLDQGSLVISRVEAWSNPTIYSVTTSIMITNSNSLEIRERDAQSIGR